MQINLTTLSSAQRKLLASLTMNVVAKLPGLATPLLVLPAISRSLGPDNYGQLLSSLAAGSAVSVVFAGVATMARREIGQAVGMEDQEAEITAFVTTLATAGSALGGATFVVCSVVLLVYASPTWALVALLPLLAAFLNLFDSIRAAYNEHYVTATIQFLTQTVALAVILMFGLPANAPVVDALALTAPYGLASLVTCALLLSERPYLLRASSGSVRVLRYVRESIVAMASDGVVGLAINVMIFFLPMLASASIAAWFGSAYRLFFALLSPVMLITLPIATFIGVRWWSWPTARRIFAVRLILTIGLCYGTLVGMVVATLGYWYIARYINLGGAVDWPTHALLCILFAGVVAHKMYIIVILSFSNSWLLAKGTMLAAVVALITATSLAKFSADLGVVGFCVLFGSGLVVLIVVDAIERMRPTF